MIQEIIHKIYLSLNYIFSFLIDIEIKFKCWINSLF